MQHISQNLFVVPSMSLMQKLTLHQKLACMSKFLAAIYPQIQLEERKQQSYGLSCRATVSSHKFLPIYFPFCYHLSRSMRLVSITAILIGLELLSACTASNPLMISLYHPKTNTLRKCAARESNPKYTEMLAGIVETCARQLEAHGFVRVDESFVPPSAIKNTPAPIGDSSP
jgi:hypothetical protein